jgi:hypothetical protein
MKYKNILLVVFFLSLFVFQQAQASAKRPLVENPSGINLSPASIPLDHIWVWVFHLNPNNGELMNIPPIPCYYQDPEFGCAEVGGYPYEPNPIYIDIENDYLPDVLAREMDVAVNYPTLEALKAQVLAARTVATWKAITPGQYYGQSNYINNSTDYQVFIPGSYDSYKNPNDPAAAQQIQGWISQAVSETQGQYLSYNGSDETIDAEFGGDFIGQSVPEGSKSYLISIQDPISTTCANNIYNGWGMSSAGAIRWSRGNQCATEQNTPWPIKWDDYRQILVHYYTGIDILDANGAKVAPDDRWNLLWHSIPSQMSSGSSYSVDLWLQNTSTTEWTDAKLGYQWIDAQSQPSAWVEIDLLSTSQF